MQTTRTLYELAVFFLFFRPSDFPQDLPFASFTAQLLLHSWHKGWLMVQVVPVHVETKPCQVQPDHDAALESLVGGGRPLSKKPGVSCITRAPTSLAVWTSLCLTSGYPTGALATSIIPWSTSKCSKLLAKCTQVQTYSVIKGGAVETYILCDVQLNNRSLRGWLYCFASCEAF